MLDDLDVGFILCITMKKQTVDSISKPTPEYAYIKNQIKIIDDLAEEQKQVELRKLAQQIFANQLEREQKCSRSECFDHRECSDKLWLLFAKGLALFVVGYMAYHFIRFLIM